MPSSKKRSSEAKGKRSGDAGGHMAGLMGLGLYGGADNDGDDADLEAELASLALTDSGSKGGGRKDKKGAAMSAREIDALVASAKGKGDGDEIGDGDEDVSDEEMNDDDILKELVELEGEEGGKGEGDEEGDGEDENLDQLLPAVPKNSGVPSKQTSASGGKESQVDTIASRLRMYEGAALKEAKDKGDSSKERRVARSIATLNTMLKQAQAGKQVNMDDLPPPISSGISDTAAGKKGGGGDDVDDELQSWVQDTGQEQGEQAKPTPPSSATKPTPSPRSSLTPDTKGDPTASKPLPSPRSSLTPDTKGDPTASKPLPSPRSSDTKGDQEDSTVQAISERTALYRQALLEAESAGDVSKVKRYKRALESLAEMMKSAKAKRPVNLDDLPPVVVVKGLASSPSAAQAASPKPDPPVAKETSQPVAAAPKPQSRTQPKPPPNMIDLNTLEFDEFNLSEDDIAAFANTLVDDRTPKQGAVQIEKPQQRSPLTAPKPQSQPKPPPNMIDLNAPDFDEFNLSEADIAAFANDFVDDRVSKQGSAQKPSPTAPNTAPDHTSYPKVSMSLPAKLPTEDTVKSLLEERRTQYLDAMKDAKAKGNEELAKEHGRTAVQFKKILGAFEQGQPVDLSQMPSPPEGYTSSYNLDLSQFSLPAQQKVPPPSGPSSSATPPSGASSSAPPPPQGAQEEGEGDMVDPSIPVPKTPLEALEQRLVKYREGVEGANQKGDSSQARRMGRIVKQYEDAIKMTKAGKPVDYSELPVPPGYPPIPTKQGAGAVRAVQQAAPSPRPTQSLPAMKQPVAAAQKLHLSTSDLQLQTLQQRSLELKMAAKEAQGKGDKETALRYMHLYKGVQTMLEAAQGGLPVDMSQLPSSPYANLGATKPSGAVMSHLKPATEGDTSTFDLIEKQLERQKVLCSSNAAAYEEMGNVATALQYKNMCENCEKELLAIKSIRSKGLSPPKFTMETRKFSIVHSNVHLGSNQCEVTVVRGLDVQASLAGCDSKDLNICVELEFPLPSESPQKASLPAVRGSQSPEINGTKLFTIDRKSLRNLQRVIKRSPLTCTLFHRRTLRKDIFLGMAHVSLEHLDTKCELKNCFDLLDEKGKKPVGGKLEVVVKLREPLSSRDEEEKEEQWLVFDESIVAPSQVSMPKPTPPKKTVATGEAHSVVTDITKTTSMEALKFEASLAQRLLKAGDAGMAQRFRLIQGRLAAIKQRYQSDSQFQQKYPLQIKLELKADQQLEQKLRAEGKVNDSRILQYRIQAMEKELQTLEQK